MRFQILGPLRLWRDGVELDSGPPQQASLLALLLARAGKPVSTTELIDLIWGDGAPSSALNIIHKYVGTLRRLLEPTLLGREAGSYLLRQGNGYLFAARDGELDLSRFRALVTAGSKLDHFVEGLRLWHGSTAEAVPAAPIHAALDNEFYDACCASAELAVRLGQPARVLAPLRLAAAMAPLHESVQASLVSVLAADGQQSEALSVFRSVRHRLAEDLGVEPGPALRDVRRRVLPATRRPAQLPPDLPVFVGRDDELARLTRLLHTPRTSPLIVALHGMAGVGKSALAARFAHHVAAEFLDGQLYLDLKERTALLGGSTGAYRTLTAGKRILVLLDNVEDTAQVRPLLPNSAGCLVLVTSRAPLVGLAARDGAHLLRVELPDPRSARELLRRRLDRQASTPEIDEIAASCDRLPLALASIAGRLNGRPQLPLATVAAELSDDTRRLAAFSAESDPSAAFAESYGRLSPAAARLFRLFSLTSPAGADAETCANVCGVPVPVARAALRELTETALIDEDERGVHSAHVLVRAYSEQLLEAANGPLSLCS
ncbi:BTAD domain-containing putative transcriptional regulator [Cryptosporangium sp. NPDC048952]|uniref:AfsR/SARP family transcriptional regulator n=1 Tax=Cryptosporangium sp. NPDC048952 TaxID=3363961 RepID=UPI00371075EA